MVKQEDLKHEVVVSSSSWFVRLYLWLWDADASDITFCKMFWGYVFSPLALLGHGVGLLYRLAPERIKDTRTDEEKLADYRKRKSTESTEPSRAVRFLEKLADVAGRVFATKFVQYLFLAVAGLTALALVALIVVLVVNNPITSLLVVAAVVIYVILMLAAASLLSSRKVKSGALTFGGLLKGGFVAVKTNTCPRITVK